MSNLRPNPSSPFLGASLLLCSLSSRQFSLSLINVSTLGLTWSAVLLFFLLLGRSFIRPNPERASRCWKPSSGIGLSFCGPVVLASSTGGLLGLSSLWTSLLPRTCAICRSSRRRPPLGHLPKTLLVPFLIFCNPSHLNASSLVTRVRSPPWAPLASGMPLRALRFPPSFCASTFGLPFGREGATRPPLMTNG